MIDGLIYGNNCVTEMLVSGNWYPILCQGDMRFSVKQEVILKTTPNSGLVREKRTRFSEASASVSGLTTIGNGAIICVFYVMQESVRQQPQSIRLTFQDDAGNSQQISGTAIITTIDLDAAANNFCECTIDLEFSGSFDMGIITAPPGGGDVIYSDTWIPVGGQNYVEGLSSGLKNGTQYSLVGKTLIEVNRSGDQYDIIANDSVPGNRQCSWQTATNRLLFQNNFFDGETVFIILK